MPLSVPPGLLLPPHVAAAVAARPEAGWLSADERARLASFAHPDRRAAFVLGRTAARGLLGHALGVAPGLVPLSVGSDGAPVVPGRFVSVAHTGRGAASVGAAAVSTGPVGIDAETVAPRRADLWRRLLAPAEHGVLDALGGPTDSAQTLLWALKEAVLKGQRTGFRAGARSVVLAFGRADGRASAVSDASGAWEIAYTRRGAAWLVVAWAEVPG